MLLRRAEAYEKTFDYIKKFLKFGENESVWHWFKETVSWWFWRRWNIYCPKYSVKHLFDIREKFNGELFDIDEKFISPCSWHPDNSASSPGKHEVKLSFLHFLGREDD